MEFSIYTLMISCSHGTLYVKLNKTAGTWTDDSGGGLELAEETNNGTVGRSGGGLEFRRGVRPPVLDLVGASWDMTPGMSGSGTHHFSIADRPERCTWTVTKKDMAQTPGSYYEDAGPGCFSPETTVLMADRTFKAIGEIVVGEEVLGLYNPHDVPHPMKVVFVSHLLVKDGFHLSINDGFSLQASGAQRLISGDGIPVSVSKLTDGQRLVAFSIGQKQQSKFAVMTVRSQRIDGRLEVYSLHLHEPALYLVGYHSILAGAEAKT
jgi:hypothetical protein